MQLEARTSADPPGYNKIIRLSDYLPTGISDSLPDDLTSRTRGRGRGRWEWGALTKHDRLQCKH